MNAPKPEKNSPNRIAMLFPSLVISLPPGGGTVNCLFERYPALHARAVFIFQNLMIQLIRPGGGEMKKINPMIGIIWGSAILVISLIAYIWMDIRNRESRLETCWRLAVTSCNIDKYIAEVEGIVTNRCDEIAYSVEVIPEFYSGDGTLLFTGDPEYIQNLDPGEQGEFKSTVYKPDYHGVACMAHISQGY
jgi:hypothetical protein